MTDASRHDAWKSGDSYDYYMGRWSRQIAPRFLDWVGPKLNLDWLEVGCGTGVLTAEILACCSPRSLVAIDPSEGFLERARQTSSDARATFQVADAQSLPLEPDTVDMIVSALVLNFIPDRARALEEMKRVARPGATIAFYVWDYPGGGIEFMRAFWTAAVSLDEAARDLTEDRRFPFCTPDGLTDMARTANLASVECVPIEVPAVFRDFEDYWDPFTLGAGPAPGYGMSLDPDARERLKQTLSETLPRAADGSIPLSARAWAVKALVS